MRINLFLCGFLGLSTAVLAAPPAPSTPSASSPLMVKAQGLLAEGKSADALDLYESAAAADPKNSAIYVSIGHAYERLGLPGKALRYYRLALDINPNNMEALESQALGLIAKGVPSKAETPIARLHKLCPKGCPALSRVEAAANSPAKPPAIAATQQTSDAERTPSPKP